MSQIVALDRVHSQVARALGHLEAANKIYIVAWQ